VISAENSGLVIVMQNHLWNRYINQSVAGRPNWIT